MNYLTEFMTDDIEERARTSSKDKNIYKIYTLGSGIWNLMRMETMLT